MFFYQCRYLDELCIVVLPIPNACWDFQLVAVSNLQTELMSLVSYKKPSYYE
jgi:hypothetical protein